MSEEVKQPVDGEFKESSISEEEAKKALVEALKKREEACAKELNEVLAKHGFAMQFQVSPMLVDNKK